MMRMMMVMMMMISDVCMHDAHNDDIDIEHAIIDDTYWAQLCYCL